MQKPLNVLFLGAGKRVSLFERLKKDFEKSFKTVNFFSIENATDVPIADLANIIVGPKFTSPDFGNFLIGEVIKNNICIIIPCMDSALSPLAASYKHTSNKCLALVSFQQNCERFVSKRLANNWFVENNIRTLRAVTIEEIESNTDPALHYLAKPHNGCGAKGQVTITKPSDLDLLEKNTQYIIQEKLVGFKEYTVDCYVSRYGDIITTVPRIRLEVTSGEVNKTVIHNNPKIIAQARKVLTKANLFGPITIQMFDTEQEPTLVEVNCRFGGGVIASFEAGCHFGTWIVNDYLGIKNTPFDVWENNLVMTRASREFFRRNQPCAS